MASSITSTTASSLTGLDYLQGFSLILLATVLTLLILSTLAYCYITLTHRTGHNQLILKFWFPPGLVYHLREFLFASIQLVLSGVSIRGQAIAHRNSTSRIWISVLGIWIVLACIFCAMVGLTVRKWGFREVASTEEWRRMREVPPSEYDDRMRYQLQESGGLD